MCPKLGYPRVWDQARSSASIYCAVLRNTAWHATPFHCKTQLITIVVRVAKGVAAAKQAPASEATFKPGVRLQGVCESFRAAHVRFAFKLFGRILTRGPKLDRLLS